MTIYTLLHVPLDEQLFNLVLDRRNLAVELAELVGGDARGDDRAGDAARTAEGGLGRQEDVRDVLVLAQERQVEENLDRLGVCRRPWISL